MFKEILKEIDYWSSPVDQVSKYIMPGKIKSTSLELETMTVLSVAELFASAIKSIEDAAPLSDVVKRFNSGF